MVVDKSTTTFWTPDCCSGVSGVVAALAGAGAFEGAFDPFLNHGVGVKDLVCHNGRTGR